MEIEIAVAASDVLGEGVTWSPRSGAVLWTDIVGKRLWTYDVATREATSEQLPDRLACFAPMRDGGLLAGFADGLATWSRGMRSDLVAIDVDQPRTRLNDGCLDREGRFVFGTMDEGDGGPQPIAQVFRYDGTTMPQPVVSGFSITNSIAFSSDGRTLYVADTPMKVIMAYDYSIDGIASNARVFAEVGPDGGYPDGSTVDSEGYLWNCEWQGHRVVRYDPNGRIDRIVRMPVSKPTCCAFGGADLATLYITSARYGMTEEQLQAEPDAGALFAIRPGVRGLADAEFRGAIA